MEALFSGKLFDGFLYPRKILDRENMPVTNSPGLVYSFLLKSTGKKQYLVPETLSRFPRLFTLGKIIVTNWLDSPDGLLTYTRHAIGI